MRKENLRIILTGAGTSAFIGTSSRHGSPAIPVKTSAPYRPRSGHQSDGLPESSSSAAVDPFGRSGNSPESVAAVELANQLYPSAITCRSPATKRALFTKRDQQRQRVCPADARRNARSRFAMTSSITTMMASCLAVFALRRSTAKPSATWRIVARRSCLTGRFQRRCVWLRTVETDRYLGSGGLQGAARESALKVLE